MPSKLSHEDYWKRRNDDINRWLDEQEIMLTQRLNAFYEQAKATTEKQLYEFYGKYAEDNKITRQDAEKRLRGVDLETYRENAERYRKWADRSPASAVRRWKKELDLQYKASQATRLDALLMDVRHEMAILSGDMEITAGGHLERVAVHAYEQAFIAPSSTLNRPAIESLVNRPFNGYNYSEDLWGNTAHLASKLEATFAKGFVQGLSVQKMAQEVRKDFNVQRANAETLIRTDGNHIVNNATLKRYEDAGLRGARIHVHIDDRTTEICKQHDRENKLYTLEEADGVLPAHFNCRSTFIPDRDELMEEHWEDELEVDPLDAEGKWHDKIKAKIKQMQDNDKAWAIDDVLKVGKIAREQAFGDSYKQYGEEHIAKLKKLKAEAEKHGKLYDDAFIKQYRGEMSQEEYKKLEANYRKVDDEFRRLNNPRTHLAFGEYFGKHIQQVRDTGGTLTNIAKHSRKNGIGVLNNVLEYLPKEWAEHMSSKPLIFVQRKGRAFFRGGNAGLEDLFITNNKSATATDYQKVYDGIYMDDKYTNIKTMLHESMHLLEARNADIGRLEREFYEKRTQGEALQRLRDVTGLNYRPSETTRVDDFIEPYMGKDYGSDTHFELLSMGMDTMYTNPSEFDNDAEYLDFILGMLMTQ